MKAPYISIGSSRCRVLGVVDAEGAAAAAVDAAAVEEAAWLISSMPFLAAAFDVAVFGTAAIFIS